MEYVYGDTESIKSIKSIEGISFLPGGWTLNM